MCVAYDEHGICGGQVRTGCSVGKARIHAPLMGIIKSREKQETNKRKREAVCMCEMTDTDVDVNSGKTDTDTSTRKKEKGQKTVPNHMSLLELIVTASG